MGSHKCDTKIGPIYIWLKSGPEEFEYEQFKCSICGKPTKQSRTGQSRHLNGERKKKKK